MHSLILGGTRGIGRVLMRQFQDQGHTVSVVGRRLPPEQDRVLAGVSHWITDISNPTRLSETLDQILRQNGKLNYLVFLQRYRGEGDEWERELAISLTATKNTIGHLSEHFVERGDRAIVMVGSIAGDHIVSEQPASYHVAKAGLRQMAAYYGVKMGGKGIRVNCVSPSIMVKEEGAKFYEENKDIVNMYNSVIPLGRMGTAEDAANIISFLCTPKAGFINGQQIVVDGGVSVVSQESFARKVSC